MNDVYVAERIEWTFVFFALCCVFLIRQTWSWIHDEMEESELGINHLMNILEHESLNVNQIDRCALSEIPSAAFARTLGDL